jgi:hypothetical protein
MARMCASQTLFSILIPLRGIECNGLVSKTHTLIALNQKAPDEEKVALILPERALQVPSEMYQQSTMKFLQPNLHTLRCIYHVPTTSTVARATERVHSKSSGPQWLALWVSS